MANGVDEKNSTGFSGHCLFSGQGGEATQGLQIYLPGPVTWPLASPAAPVPGVGRLPSPWVCRTDRGGSLASWGQTGPVWGQELHPLPDQRGSQRPAGPHAHLLLEPPLPPLLCPINRGPVPQTPRGQTDPSSLFVHTGKELFQQEVNATTHCPSPSLCLPPLHLDEQFPAQ